MPSTAKHRQRAAEPRKGTAKQQKVGRQTGSRHRNTAGNPAEREGGMHISELKESKFLKKEDCGNGILVTVESVHQENIAKEGAPEEMKWVVTFLETEKPMVLNSTNGQIIAKITGSEESDDWTGASLVLFHDPNVSFGGKLVGGIRVRAPRKQPVPVTGKKPVKMPVAKQEQTEESAEEDGTGEGTPF